jgi:hypothetical protein
MKTKYHKSKMRSMGTKQFITLLSIHISLVSRDTNLDAFGSLAQAHPALSSEDGRLVKAISVFVQATISPMNGRIWLAGLGKLLRAHAAEQGKTCLITKRVRNLQ